MERILILSHVAAGGLVLLLGLVNFINRKGGRFHKTSGKWYVGAMWWICLSALLVMVFYRFSFFLLVISVLTFYTSFAGIRVLRRKEFGRGQWYDWLVSALTALFGAGLILYGIRLGLIHGLEPIVVLSFFFGFVTLKTGYDDLRFFQSPQMPDKKWWLRQHISAMGGSYIAAVTAFAVQNSEFFIPIESLRWLTWVIPAAIGSPVVSIFVRKHKVKASAIPSME